MLGIYMMQQPFKTAHPLKTSVHFEGLGDESNTRIRHSHVPLTVWCHKPPRWSEMSPVVFVMHGIKRNARKYLKVWRKYANRHNFLLLVPEFSKQHYPWYTVGNSRRSTITDPCTIPSTYMRIEHIFDAVQTRLQFRATSYAIYGHSAGAQFVHRLLLFVPDTRIATAICANAGWYTMLTESRPFPYGLQGSGLSPHDLSRALEKKLILWLGENDTDPRHKHLKRSTQARAQGKHRLERGKRFYEMALQEAARLGVACHWELHIAHGVGHSNSRMAKQAMTSLYPYVCKGVLFAPTGHFTTA